MRQVLSKLLNISFAFLLLITCVSCKRNNKELYTNLMWLKDMALKANIYSENDIDYFHLDIEDRYLINGLIDFGIIKNNEEIDMNKQLEKAFLIDTLYNLINIHDDKNDKLNYLKELQIIIDEDLNDIDYNKANTILDRAINYINNQIFNDNFEIDYKEDAYYIEDIELIDNYYPITKDYPIGSYLIDEKDKIIYQIIERNNEDYILKEISYEEAIEEIDFSGTMDDIDFSEAEVIIDEEVLDVSSIYDDERINRLANIKTSDTFEKNGFRISYSISLNKIHLHISKKTEKGINVYYDGDIYGIKPSYKWNYDGGMIKEAYLKVDFKTSSSMGMSIGRYKTLYGDFESFKGQDLFNSLKNFLKPKSDLVETSFTLMKIKVPISGVPIATFDIELKLNIYLSGKVEIALSTDNALGLEIRNNHLRLINDHKENADFNISATASSTLSIIFSLNLFKDLIDARLNGGIKAKASSTLHLYDDDGNLNSESIAGEYDALNELVDNEDVFVCADLSLSWILNIELNSDKTLAHTLGFSKTFNILDEDDQVFNNLHHIEKGMFVERCSYKKRQTNNSENVSINSDRITLESYSMVIRGNAKIKVKSLPKDYEYTDLCFSSEDENIIKVDKEGSLMPIKNGVTRVRIYTSDDKYEVYINVLVSSDEMAFHNI